MVNRGSRKRTNKNEISNVRIVDPAEGLDAVQAQRFLQEYVRQEGQIRVVCSYRAEFGFATVATGFSVSFPELVSTDDFASFAAQYQEFRVRFIWIDVIDLFGTAGASNFWATFHQVGGAAPTGIEDVVDRPDSRSISAGEGKISLAWVAHGIPEMAFQSVSSYDNLGGLVAYLGSTSVAQGGRYSVVVKFGVDFRGRR